MAADTALILFTLSPDAEEKRKGRIAPGRARRLFGGLIEHLRDQVRDLDGVDLLVSAPDGWSPSGARALPQRGDGFGPSLRLAVADAFDAGYSKVLVIGNDAPGLTTEHLREAVARVSRGAHRAVVTPTVDGGFALLGVSCAPEPYGDRCTDLALDRIRWGGATVFDDTLDLLVAAGFRVATLEMVEDIDSAADLRRFLRRGRYVPALHGLAARLRSWLAPAAPRRLSLPPGPVRSMTPPIRSWRAPPA